MAADGFQNEYRGGITPIVASQSKLRYIPQFCFPPISPLPDEPHFYAIRLTDDKARNLFACCLAFTDGGSAFRSIHAHVSKTVDGSNEAIESPSVLPAAEFRSSLDTKVLMLVSQLPLFSTWETLLRAILRTYSGRFELDILSAYTPAGWLLPHRAENGPRQRDGGKTGGSGSRANGRLASRPRANAETSASRAGLQSSLGEIVESPGELEDSASSADSGSAGLGASMDRSSREEAAGTGGAGSGSSSGQLGASLSGRQSPADLAGGPNLASKRRAVGAGGAGYDSSGEWSASDAASDSTGGNTSRDSGAPSAGGLPGGFPEHELNPDPVPPLEELDPGLAASLHTEEVLGSVRAERGRRARRWCRRVAELDDRVQEGVGATRVESPGGSVDGSDEEDDGMMLGASGAGGLAQGSSKVAVGSVSTGSSPDTAPKTNSQLEIDDRRRRRRSQGANRRESTVGPLVSLGVAVAAGGELPGLPHSRSRSHGSFDSTGKSPKAVGLPARTLRRADSGTTAGGGVAYTSIASSTYGGDYEDDDDLTSIGGGGDSVARPSVLERRLSRRSVVLHPSDSQKDLTEGNETPVSTPGARPPGIPGPPPRPPGLRQIRTKGWSQSTRLVGSRARAGAGPAMAPLRTKSHAELVGSATGPVLDPRHETGSLALSSDDSAAVDETSSPAATGPVGSEDLPEDEASGAARGDEPVLSALDSHGLEARIRQDPVLARIAAEEALSLVPRCLLRLRPAPPILDAPTVAIAAGGPTAALNPSDGTASPTDAEISAELEGQKPFSLLARRAMSSSPAGPFGGRHSRVRSGSSSRSLLHGGGAYGSKEGSVYGDGRISRGGSRRSRGQSVAAEEMDLVDAETGGKGGGAAARTASGDVGSVPPEEVDGDEEQALGEEMLVTRRNASGDSGAGPSHLMASVAGARAAIGAVFSGMQFVFDPLSGRWVSSLSVPRNLRLAGYGRSSNNAGALVRGAPPDWLWRFSSGASCGSCLDCGIGAPGMCRDSKQAGRSASGLLRRSAASLLGGRAKAAAPVPLEQVLMALIFDLPVAVAAETKGKSKAESAVEVALQGLKVCLHLPLLPPLPRSVEFRGRPTRPSDGNDETAALAVATPTPLGSAAHAAGVDEGRGVPGLLSDLPLEQEGRGLGPGMNLQIRVPTSSGLPYVDPSCLLELFQCLSPEAVCAALSALMMEQRTVLFSNHMWRLTACLEGLTALMFPFQWPHTAMTSMPADDRLWQILTAPVHIISGMHEGTIRTEQDRKFLRELAQEAVMLRLDDNRIHFPKRRANESDDSDDSEAKTSGHGAAAATDARRPVSGARKRAGFSLFPRHIVHQLCTRLRKILPKARMDPLPGEWDCEHDVDEAEELPSAAQDETRAGEQLTQRLLDGRLSGGHGAFQCWAEEVRMAFLECMVALVRNVEHFAAMRKGAQQPGPEVTRQAGMPVSAESESAELGKGSSDEQKEAAAGVAAASDGTKKRGGRGRPRASSRMGMEISFETKAFALSVASVEHQKFLREFADPLRNTVFTYFLQSFRGCSEHAPTLSLTKYAASQAGVKQFFDLPAAIRAVETVSRGMRRGKQADMASFLREMAGAIGVPSSGSSAQMPGVEGNSVQGTPSPARGGRHGKRGRGKLPLTQSDRNAIHFVLLLRAHRIAMAARTGWSRLAEVGVHPVIGQGATQAGPQAGAATGARSRLRGVAGRQRRLTLSLLIPKDTPPQASTAAVAANAAPPTVPRGLLGFAVGFFTGNRATPSATAATATARVSGVETQEDRYSAMKKALWSEHLWNPCTSGFVGALLQLALRSHSPGKEDGGDHGSEGARGADGSREIRPMLPSLSKVVASPSNSTGFLGATTSRRQYSPSAGSGIPDELAHSLTGYADGCLLLDFGEDEALAEQVELHADSSPARETRSAVQAALGQLGEVSKRRPAGSPSRAGWICTAMRGSSLRNLARVQLSSRYSPVIVFPRLDPTLLPVDSAALAFAQSQHTARISLQVPMPVPFAPRLSNHGAEAGQHVPSRTRSAVVSQLFSPQLRPLHLLAGDSKDSEGDAHAHTSTDALELVRHAIRAVSDSQSDEQATKRLMYDVLHAPGAQQQPAVIPLGRHRGGLAGGSFSIGRKEVAEFSRIGSSGGEVGRPDKGWSAASATFAASKGLGKLVGADSHDLVSSLCGAMIRLVRERNAAVAELQQRKSEGLRRGSHRASLSLAARRAADTQHYRDGSSGAFDEDSATPSTDIADGQAVAAAAARLPVDSTPKQRMRHALKRLVASGDVNRAMALARTATSAGGSPARGGEGGPRSSAELGSPPSSSAANGLKPEVLASVAADAAQAAMQRMKRLKGNRRSMLQIAVDTKLNSPALADALHGSPDGQDSEDLEPFRMPRRQTVGEADREMLRARRERKVRIGHTPSGLSTRSKLGEKGGTSDEKEGAAAASVHNMSRGAAADAADAEQKPAPDRRQRRFSAGGVLEPSAVAQFEARRRLSAIVRQVMDDAAATSRQGAGASALRRESTEASTSTVLSQTDASEAHRTIRTLVQRARLLEERCDAYGLAYRDTLSVIGEARRELMTTHRRLVDQEATATEAVQKEAASSAAAQNLRIRSTSLQDRVAQLEKQVAHLQESRAQSDDSLMKLQGAVVHALSARVGARGTVPGRLSREEVQEIMQAARSVKENGYAGKDIATAMDAVSEFRLLPIDEVHTGGPLSTAAFASSASPQNRPAFSSPTSVSGPEDPLALSKSPTKPPRKQPPPPQTQDLAPLHAQLHEEISARKRVVALAREAASGQSGGVCGASGNLGVTVQDLRDRALKQAAIARARLIQFHRVFGATSGMPTADRSDEAAGGYGVSSGSGALGKGRGHGAWSRGGVAVSADRLSSHPLVLDAMQRFGGADYGHYPRRPPMVDAENADSTSVRAWLGAEVDRLLATGSRGAARGGQSRGGGTKSASVRRAWTVSGAVSSLWDEVALQAECLHRSVQMLQAATGDAQLAIEPVSPESPVTTASPGAAHLGAGISRRTPQRASQASGLTDVATSPRYASVGKAVSGRPLEPAGGESSGRSGLRGALQLEDLQDGGMGGGAASQGGGGQGATRRSTGRGIGGMRYTSPVSSGGRSTSVAVRAWAGGPGKQTQAKKDASAGRQQTARAPGLPPRVTGNATARVGSRRAHRGTSGMAATSRDAAALRKQRLLGNLRRKNGERT